jgi:Family of unknown function (DUF6134)
MPKGGQISGGLQSSPWSGDNLCVEFSMRIAVGTFSAIVAVTLAALLVAATMAAQMPSETMRFAIMRNGEQIGTHAIEISRKGPETDVHVTTELAVKVLFVTAYQLQHHATERWMNGQLVALDSTTDNNGVRHRVSAVRGMSGLEVNADGKTSRVDQNVFPASLWNPEILRRKAALDTQDGKVDPISVMDDGSEDLRLGAKALKAHHYEIKGRYSQHIWYDERGRLVQAKLIGSDGSEISYKPM